MIFAPNTAIFQALYRIQLSSYSFEPLKSFFCSILKVGSIINEYMTKFSKQNYLSSILHFERLSKNGMSSLWRSEESWNHKSRDSKESRDEIPPGTKKKKKKVLSIFFQFFLKTSCMFSSMCLMQYIFNILKNSLVLFKLL